MEKDRKIRSGFSDNKYTSGSPRVARRVFLQNLVDERGVPPGPLVRLKFPILSRSLVMTKMFTLWIEMDACIVFSNNNLTLIGQPLNNRSLLNLVNNGHVRLYLPLYFITISLTKLSLRLHHSIVFTQH
eukprot:sb/3475259/